MYVGKTQKKPYRNITYKGVQVYETAADHREKAFVIYQTCICRQLVAGSGTWDQRKAVRQIETNSGKFRQIQTVSDRLKLFARYRDENLAPAAAGLPFEQDCPRVRWNPPFF